MRHNIETMRRALFLAVLFLAGAAHAEPSEDMFEKLRAAPSDSEAHDVAMDIWASWMESGSPTVDVIMQRGVDAQTGGDLETARQALMLLPNVENVAVVGNELEARIAGGEEEASAILGELMQQGIQIAEFKRRGGDLESLFMQITGKEAEGEAE